MRAINGGQRRITPHDAGSPSNYAGAFFCPSHARRAPHHTSYSRAAGAARSNCLSAYRTAVQASQTPVKRRYTATIRRQNHAHRSAIAKLYGILTLSIIVIAKI